MGQAKDGSVQSQQSRIEPSDTLKQQGAGRILIAGEFANNWGHLGCMLAMARAYRAAGHEVVLVVSDLNAARSFFAANEFPLLQAPVLRITQQPAPHQGAVLNFADLLWRLGYADSNALAVAMEAWIELLAEIKPTLLIYVNAPTAMLAAHALCIPALLVGGAFDIPPATPLLPVLREAVDVLEQELAALRAVEVVENINTALGRFKRPVIESLGDLFPAEEVRLTTLPELDPFGPRLAEQYVGPIFALPTIHRIGWKDTGTDTRIFAYLHPQAPVCESVLQVLNSLDAEVLCVMPGRPAEWSARFDRITFYAQPLELAFLLPRAHLVITGGVATMTTALLNGLPILSVPHTLEQRMVARALERNGASRVASNDYSHESVAETINELLRDQKYKQAAVRVAMKYMATHFEDNAKLLIK